MERYWIKLLAALSFADMTILIENGKAECKRGKACSALLSELSELSENQNLKFACIKAWMTPTGLKLSFMGVPEHLRQRFRNVWGVHWK
jgi:hypothetical protein